MRQNASTEAARSSDLPKWMIPVFIMILGAVSLFAVAYQANALVRESRYQATKQIKYSDALTVQVSYPKKLRLEKPPRPGHPISVWLVASQLPTETLTFTISMEPTIGDIVFTDRDGVPSLTPQATLSPTRPAGTPMTWYVQRTPGDGSDRLSATTVTRLNLQVRDALGQELIRWTLPIELESPFGAWWRQFWDVVFGPATPQIGLIGVLLALAWRWFEKDRDARLERERKDLDERQEREEKDRQERQRRRRQRELADITALDAFWQTDPTGAVDQYCHLRTHVSQDDVELAGRLERMWRATWRARILDQAFEAYRDNEHQRAEKLASLVKDEKEPANRGLVDKADKGEASQLLTVLSSLKNDSTQDLLAVRLEAIMALAITRATVLGEKLAPLLLELLPADNRSLSSQTIKVFGDLNTSGKLPSRWLLHETKVRERLRMLGQPESPDESNLDIKSAVDRLLSERPYVWAAFPRLSDRAPASSVGSQCARVLKELNWLRNPFAQDQVEQDPPERLQAYVLPPLWSAFINPRPFVFSADSGAGQTSALWKAAWEWRTRTLGADEDARRLRFFPVFVDVRLLLPSPTRSACYEALFHDIVQTLLQFLLYNPGSFAAMPRSQQRAMSRLISAYRQRVGDLGAYFRSVGASAPREEVNRLDKMLTVASQAAKPCVITDEADLLSVIADAHVQGFDDYALILDISNRDLQRHGLTTLTSRLDLVFDMIPALTSARVIVKAGIPNEVSGHLALKPPATPIRWSHERLTMVLTERLRWANEGMKGVDASGSKPRSMGELFSRVPDADEQIVFAAKGSPRRLIKLCNSLITRLENKPEDEILTAEDLEQEILYSE